MRIVLILTAIIYLLIAAPVFAESNHENNGNDRGNAVTEQTIHSNDVKTTNDADKDEDTGKPTKEPQNITPSCDPSTQWKNHGAFVSCVAHLHQNRDEDKDQDSDEAARFALGKKHFLAGTPAPTNAVTPTEIPTPTEIVSSTPEETPNPTENISESPTASVSPTPETEFDIYKAPQNNFQNTIKTTLGGILFFLAHLL